MDEKKLHSLISRVTKKSSDNWDYSVGYMRGLMRLYRGGAFGTEADHGLWLSLVDDADEFIAQRGQGYLDGCAGPDTNRWGYCTQDADRQEYCTQNGLECDYCPLSDCVRDCSNNPV